MCALYRQRIRVQEVNTPAHATSVRFSRALAVRTGLIAVLTLSAVLLAHTAEADAIAVVLPSDGLRLRAAPGTDQRTLDTIPGGTRLAITGSANAEGWYPAVYKRQRGWVNGTFLAFDDLTAAATRKGTVTTADGLNVRAAPLESADLLQTLPQGATVTATGRATSDGWALIFAGEKSGWANAAYLQFEGESVTAVNAPGTPVPPHPSGVPAARVVVRYYGAEFEGGRMACGGVYRSDDPTIAATNSWPCGTTLRICTGPSCIAVRVTDKGGMAPMEIDLSVAGFQRLGSLAAGSLTATADVMGQ